MCTIEQAYFAAVSKWRITSKIEYFRSNQYTINIMLKYFNSLANDTVNNITQHVHTVGVAFQSIYMIP